MSKLPGLLQLALLSTWAFSFTASTAPAKKVPKTAMEQKLAYLHENSLRAHPDPKPTQFGEQEVNAFIAAGGLRLPAGVQSLRFEGEPGAITAFTKVDFDQVRAGSRSMNPLLSVFSGVHDVVVMAHGEGLHGQGTVHIDWVSLDGVEVPNFILVLFAEKFITPKHPDLGVDSHFALPERINTATVGTHQLAVLQK
jgi:hypothetical protein